ncbi:MAG: hypothetical protein ACRC16_22040 [Aeromonas salmonicida]
MAQEESVWVLVDCISQYRTRYMVQAPVSHPEWALDTVVMEEGREFSQEWLGETIVSHRVVSHEEALAQCRKDNDYAYGYTDQQLELNFFTAVDDSLVKETPEHQERESLD